METLHAFISLQIILSFAHRGLGLMSDYKTCGDPACERMMSRVQALRDHHAQDCRFLSFKKGDMIVVYYKLSGKRSDLWAGSIDKQSGLFPKDAVRIDEVFVDEEKEIKMPTQKYDFYCMDEFGSVIESDSNEIEDQDDQHDQHDQDDQHDQHNQEDQDDQTAESEELGNSDFDDPLSKSAETNDIIKTEEAGQSATQESSKQDPEKSEKSGSSWIGSAVNGWFGGGEEVRHDEPPEEGSDQVSFKGRKLALDIDENQLQVEKQAKTFGWIGDELTNVFGFGQKALKDTTEDSPEDVMQNDENSPSTQSSWLEMGIKDVLSFASGDNLVKSEAEDKNEGSIPKDEKNFEPTQPLDSTEASQGDNNEPNQGERQEATSFIEEDVDPSADKNTESEKIRGKEDSGWYGSVYNQFTSFYGDAKDKIDISNDGGGDGLSEADVQQPIQSIEDIEDEGSQDPSPKECGDEGCVTSNEETPNYDEDTGNDPKVEDSSSTGTSEGLINNAFSDEQGLSEDVADENPVPEDAQAQDGDAATSDWMTTSKKTESHPDENRSTEEFVEPEETKNGGDLYQYAAFVGQVTSDTFAYVIKESAHLMDVIYEVLTMAEEFKSESAVTEANDIGGTARIYYSLALEKIRDVVSSLPDDIRPGPDLYGLPWEVVLFTASIGLFIVLLFSCRFIHSIKSRLYASKERRMGQKVAELLEEKCKVLETLSECKHKFEKLETALQNGGVSAQEAERENLEVMSKKLEQSNAEMKSDIERLQEELENQSKLRKQQEEQLAELEETLKSLEDEAKEHKSQLEQDKTTLKIHEMNSERLQKKLQAAKEENTMLLESKAQLVQEAEGWGERLSELEEEMRMCERSHAGMVEDCTNKDERIKSLTDCLLKMKDWDSEEEGSVDSSSDAAGSEKGSPADLRQKQKVQKLIHAAKLSADLKAMEEDKGRVVAKLADEIKAKEDLQDGIEQMQKEKESLESESSMYSSEIQKLQQKLQIMTEMYQENELKLHRMLTVEERERSQKEEKLTKAGKKISLAAEELNNYRQRAKELEEELERTNQAYKNQIASHEKKAHDNWLAARAADRDLADVKRENSLLRQRLTDYQFKLELMEKEPYARDAQGRPVFRGERSPYGPSPLGRPSSETRAFLSPPTLMEGPPRLSPQFPIVPGGRVSRGVLEPPAGGLECERSGPLSDSGSASPNWERERRGPGAPPGPPPPDPGMPYRRPPPGPFPMGPMPPRPPPPESYFGDKPDLTFLGNSSGPGENESRDSLHSMPDEARPPPDADMRMGPPHGPPMRLTPPMDPRDPHFPHRIPYGPLDYFPPRGPGGPPLGMRGPPPPGMFPRVPLPHPMAYPMMRPPPDGFLPGPPLRPPLPDSFPPGPPLGPPLRPPPPDSFQPGPPPRPPPQGSEQPPEQPPSPHDVI
ncbi:cTAGE family member 8 isoform X4 [Colossoma macropomum]|uniref:cTAGE family member 8 isoform X4 n=1 Tax=Colossoma macropomum TaxID=42526 RepID=UPI00186416AD|nr:cTAGE family member 8 isoform X4 [Colossoma macropomum]